MIDRKHLDNMDWILLLAALAVSILGVVTIFSVTHSDPPLADYQKQVVWILGGLGVVVFTSLWDYRIWLKPAWILYLGVAGMLTYVLIFGQAELGVRRWILLPGGYRFQPSEFAKIASVLILARWMSRWHGTVPKIRHVLIPAILVGLPIGLILIEPDLGTALSLIPVFISMIFISGFSIRKMLFIAIVCIASFIISAPYVLKPYQIKRITSFMHPEKDPLGSGYHLLQSQIAIGSGGIMGKGYLSGTQSHLDFLPVQDTDFIFAVWGEERGFAGAVFLIILYMVLLLRAIRLARLARDFQGMYLCIGFTTLLFTQMIVNIGMVIGLMPITGLPLPFMSYGGSAMLANYFAVGIILNVGMRRFASYAK